MNLTKFSWITLEVLLFLDQKKDGTTIKEICTELNVSKDHLAKSINLMSKEGWVITTRGKNGGVIINVDTYDMSLGEIILCSEKNSRKSHEITSLKLTQNENLLKQFNVALSVFYESLLDVKLSVLLTK